MENEEEVCCPRFDPALWDGKTLDWEKKPFVRAKVFTFFYAPLNLGSVMRRLDAQISQAGAGFEDAMALSEHTSMWSMWQYLAVDRPIPGMDNVPLSGQFKVKVYEGPFEDTGKWMKDFDEDNKAKGLKMKNTFMWYTTCPKCAKKYGKNYVAVLGQLA